MRGRIKVATRYSAFRKAILEKFTTEEGVSSEFVAFLRANETLNWAFVMHCDENEDLLFLEPGPPTAVYQILRLTDKPILLRQLEPLADFIWGSRINKSGKQSLYTALCVLQGTNLIDYQFRDFESSPSNILQFFVKEEV
jgi:hypothetical protein